MVASKVRRFQFFLIFLGGFWIFVYGCSGKPLTKIEENAPADLPFDLQQKFDVKDVVELSSHPGPSSTTLTTPQALRQPEVQKKKKKKGEYVTNGVALDQQYFEYPNRRLEKDPIWLSETQVFQITYFGVAAGEFTLKVLPHKVVNHRKVYHIRGNAVSSKLFSLFYKINDMVETFIDYEGMFSHRFHLTLDETKQTRDSLELYDSEKKQTFFWNRWNHKVKGYIEIKDYFSIQPFSQDTLSALYYLRTVPLPNGHIFTFPVVSEGKTWDAEVTVVRREMVNSPMGKVQAIVLKPETKYQGVLQKRGDSFLWLSDDDRHYLLRLEAKVRIGTVVAVLKSLEPGVPPPEESSPSESAGERELSSKAIQ